MATHSSTLAWKIPGTEEPSRLRSMGVTKSWPPLSTHIYTLWKKVFDTVENTEAQRG